MALPTPLAYWPFDEGTGTTAADASGNGHTATLVNGTWDTSALKKFGAAALKNTDVSRAASFTFIPVGTTHSIAFWMNGWDGSNDGVMLGAALSYHACYVTSTNLSYQVTGGNLVQTSHGGLTGSHHVAITRAGASVSIYKDGTHLHTGTLGANDAWNMDSIGAYTAGQFPFVGTLDEVRIYDVALSGAQVAELYALIPTAPGGADRVDTFVWMPG